MARINKTLIYLSGLLMLALTLLANVQVLFRYLLQLPLPWVEEAIRYLMVYMVFIMGSVAIYTRIHLNMDAVDMFLSKKAAAVIDRVRLAFIFLFCVYYAYLAFRFVKETIALGQVTPALQISMAVPLSALLIGSMLMAVNALSLLWKPDTPNMINQEFTV